VNSGRQVKTIIVNFKIIRIFILKVIIILM